MAYYFGIHTGGKDFNFGPYSTITGCRKELIRIYGSKYKKKYPRALLPVFSDKNGYEGAVDEFRGRYVWVTDDSPTRYINKNGSLGRRID